jgi:hypothetical protein
MFNASQIPSPLHHTSFSSSVTDDSLSTDYMSLNSNIDRILNQGITESDCGVKFEPVRPVPPEMKCQYKTGTCTNMRTTKKNGKLLMLCESHRRKQNEIKKRSDRKQSALRMNKRLEAKLQSSKEEEERHKFKLADFDYGEAYPKKKVSMSWDQVVLQDNPRMHLPALVLPRVNVWRTKDGIATGHKNMTTKSVPMTPSSDFMLPNSSFFAPDWSPRSALPSLTPTGKSRNHDLAILEFFLEDAA